MLPLLILFFSFLFCTSRTALHFARAAQPLRARLRRAQSALHLQSCAPSLAQWRKINKQQHGVAKAQLNQRGGEISISAMA